MDADAILDQSSRCLLAVRGRRQPVVWPMPQWFDGSAVWMTAPADVGQVAALRRDPACAVAVPPAADDHPGVAATGQARVFTPAEPLRFALHAPAISAAMSALAVRHTSDLWHYASHPSRLVAQWPHQRVVLRVALDTLDLVEPPAVGPGVSPPLPTVVPTDVRRRLGGRRAVLALWDQPPLRLAAAGWTAGLALTFAPRGPRPRSGDRVAVALEDQTGTPHTAVGAVVHGELGDDHALTADRVTWWRGFEVHRNDLAGPSTTATVIPD